MTDKLTIKVLTKKESERMQTIDELHKQKIFGELEAEAQDIKTQEQ